MALFALITRVPKHIALVRSRAEFKAKFGVDAPEWDPSRPVKDWIDQRVFSPEKDEEEVEYRGIRYLANGLPATSGRDVQLVPFKLFPEVAQSINLLPEPLPPQGALSDLHLRMSQRRVPLPLDLAVGEKVVLAPGLGMDPVVDDGKANPSAAVGYSQRDRDLLERIAAKVGAV